MADIFLSYAREDREIAERMVEVLRTAFGEERVFWDDDLRAGDPWRQALETRLEQARCAIVLWSSTSVTKEFVSEEASRAKDRGILVHALLAEGVRLPLGFGEVQYERLSGWCRSQDPQDADLRRLIEAIERRLQAKRALLIGAGNYGRADFMPALPAARGSIEELERVLGSRSGGSFNVAALSDPTRQQMAVTVEKFMKQASSDDVVLVYYTGHGKIGADGRLYLCASDTDPDALDSTSVSLNWLARRTIDKTRSSRVVIILDCRYGLADPRSGAYEVAQVLQAELGPGQGKYLFTSTTSLEHSPEDPAQPCSRLVSLMAQGLLDFEADFSRDGVITVDELYRFLESELARGAPDSKPMKWAFDVSAGQVELVRKRRTTGPVPALPPKNPHFYRSVKAAIHEGRSVPLLGDGIYSNGPLGSFQLMRAVIQQAGGAGLKVDERYPLATAAEYLLMSLEERSSFLATFRRILDTQQQQVGSVATHGVILDCLPQPWVVVSATYDWVLERTLRAKGLPFTVVSHVLYSDDELAKERLLVLRSPGEGREPTAQIMHGDQFTLRDAPETSGRVIYKLVGSPFLNDFVPGHDTVVVTETDHVRFLSGLRTRETTIPEQLQAHFKRNALLLLGYNLDIWHYRLIGHVFSKNGLVPPSGKRRYAVRTATSNIEELFWTQIVESDWRLQSDCDDFARTLEGMADGRS
jgi:TIR domain/Caspase domain/SIR2-like domain